MALLLLGQIETQQMPVWSVQCPRQRGARLGMGTLLDLQDLLRFQGEATEVVIQAYSILDICFW